ncbi:hypothetical protein HG537_0C03040 [Torulaspora globosa]|uniref:phosphatidylinositol-3,4,5-trisphosphate 3-phosphatase n=1 Tax=Torulaspora globosa TaxID=48254 RepID=A0A7H9HR27_9SACH|nr:hypothetical protein HG537_0C03040 [Torulaspora sp. CBS 2947]
MTKKISKVIPRNILKVIYATPLKGHKQETDFTLDLSYVTDRIIVCSYPVLKFPKLMYRNNLEELITFLNIHHGVCNWKIFNFKAEIGRSDYTDEEVAEIANKFYQGDSARLVTDISDEHPEQLVCRYGWMDHCPPPFLLLQRIVDEIHQHLSRSQSAVAVLHCRVGKGRSGTIAIAYLMKYLECPLSEARDTFMHNRFKRGITRGVVISSQLRYLRYHELFLSYDFDLRNKFLRDCANARFQLKSIHLDQPSGIIISNYCVAYIKIQKYNDDRDGLVDLASLETDDDLLGQPMGRGLTICLPLDTDTNDIRLEFGITSKTSHMVSSLTSLASRSHCWFNLYWETFKCTNFDGNMAYLSLEELQNYQDRGHDFHLQLKWNELDGAMGTANRGLKLFESLIIKWSLA